MKRSPEELKINYKRKEEKKTRLAGNLLEQALEIVKKYDGRIESLACEDDQQLLRLRCTIDHKFSLNLEKLRAGCWCKKCEERLARYKKHHGKFGSKILADRLTKVLLIQCAMGHTFKSHIRRILRKVCPDCKKSFKV